MPWFKRLNSIRISRMEISKVLQVASNQRTSIDMCQMWWFAKLAQQKPMKISDCFFFNFYLNRTWPYSLIGDSPIYLNIRPVITHGEMRRAHNNPFVLGFLTCWMQCWPGVRAQATRHAAQCAARVWTWAGWDVMMMCRMIGMMMMYIFHFASIGAAPRRRRMIRAAQRHIQFTRRRSHISRGCHRHRSRAFKPFNDVWIQVWTQFYIFDNEKLLHMSHLRRVFEVFVLALVVGFVRFFIRRILLRVFFANFSAPSLAPNNPCTLFYSLDSSNSNIN